VTVGIRDRATTESAPRQAPRRRRRPWGYGAVVALCALFLLASLPAYVTLDPARALVTSFVASFPAHYALLLLHIGAGTVAMVTGCVQLSARIRRRAPRAHRIIGRAYAAAVVLGAPALAALVVLRAIAGDAPSTAVTVGFGLGTVLWAGVTVAGVRAARQRRFADHRTWMTYSMAFTLSIIMSRVAFVIAMLVPGFDMRYVEENVGWFPWVATVLIARWLLMRRDRRPRVVPA